MGRAISQTINLQTLQGDSKYITKIDNSGITIHPEVWSGQTNYIQITGDGLKIYKDGKLKGLFGAITSLYANDGSNNNGTYPKTDITSNGITIAYSDLYKTSVDNVGLKIYAGDSSTPVAQFGAIATIGKTDTYHLSINNKGIEIDAGSNYGGGIIQGQNQGICITVPGENSWAQSSATSYLILQNWTQSMFVQSTTDLIGTATIDAKVQDNVGTYTGMTARGNSNGGQADSGTISVTVDKYQDSDSIKRVVADIRAHQIMLHGDVNILGQNQIYSSDLQGLSCLYFNYIPPNYSTYSGNLGLDTVSARSAVSLPATRIVQVSNNSSRQFKNSINPIVEKDIDPHLLYGVEVIQFKYNTDYVHEGDARYDRPIPGFIAEDLYKIYPMAIDLDEDKKPKTWNPRYIIPPMLKLIQEQHIEIELLKNKIEKMEEKIL